MRIKTIVIFTISWLSLLGGSFWIFRKWVRRDYLQRGQLRWSSTLLQALIFFVYGGFPMIYGLPGWPSLPANLIQRFLGVFGVVVGLTGVLYGMVRLGVLRSMGRGEPGLRQTGMYAVTRNPQAILCGFYVIGFVLLWPSWYAVGWGLLYFILVHIMILTEEEYLAHLHGEAYQRYCERVPRYLVFL